MRTLQKRRGGEYQVPEIEIVDVMVEAGICYVDRNRRVYLRRMGYDG